MSLNAEKLREDFPVLRGDGQERRIIYFDNACMTLKPVQVIDALSEYYRNFPACAGRSIHRLSSEVEERWHDARKIVKKHIGARKENEVVFTRNTTEGINLVAHSLGLGNGDIVVTSDREHNSNLVPWMLLENKGVKRICIKSKEDGTFDLNGFDNAMSQDVNIVSIVHTSNLDGYTLPVKEIVKISHDYGSLVMLDGAQAMPHKEVNVKRLGVDFYAFSGHKMLGPTGTGILYGKMELLEDMQPFMTGGETVEKTTYQDYMLLGPPEKFEAGLQDYAGMIGLAAAIKYLEGVGKERISRHEQGLNKIITQGLREISGASIIGPEKAEMRGGIISFMLEGMHYHDIAMLLDRNAGIMIRSGQHCVHSWFNAHGIDGSARVSLYFYNTKEEAEVFVEEMKRISELR